MFQVGSLMFRPLNVGQFNTKRSEAGECCLWMCLWLSARKRGKIADFEAFQSDPT